MVHSIITDTSLKDKGKDVPIHAIKLCVGGWGKGDVAFILLELNRGYGLDEWGKGVRYLAETREVSLVLAIRTGSVTYTTAMQ